LEKICNSIKELKLYTQYEKYYKENMENYGIIKLIENQRRLSHVQLHFESLEYIISTSKKLYYKFLQILINSLNKHLNTIKYFKMKKLDSDDNYHLENLSLPLLKILHARNVSIKNLINLIENTIGNLVEIKIDQINDDDDDNKRIIQTIYLNCTKLNILNY
jgi:hypothetical protein